MKKKIIPIGSRFGRLVVQGEAINAGKQRQMQCACDCGATKHVAPFDLTNGRVLSCGCAKKERAKALGRRNRTHGHTIKGTRSPTYLTWQNMMQRCYDPKTNGFSSYGGVGIRVTDRWHDFTNFLEDMGERPSGKTLDRSDANSGYSPDNCRWATPEDQAKNRRVTRWIEYRGETRPAAEWASIFGTHRNNIYRRHARGAPLEG